MSKLYEILAVEPDLKKEAQEEAKRVVALFGQPGKLTGQNISFHPTLEGEPELADEITELAYTVEEELEKAQKAIGDFIDATVEKEVTNTITVSSVFLGEFEFLKNLPATALLNLESRLEELKKIYDALPTLDPSERWKFDEDLGHFVSELREQFRTKKVLRNHVLAEATKEHPAQVQVYQEDIPSYKVEKVISSGMITPADKFKRLERLTKLQAVVKRARQRANDVELVEVSIANKIFSYIDNGL